MKEKAFFIVFVGRSFNQKIKTIVNTSFNDNFRASKTLNSIFSLGTCFLHGVQLLLCNALCFEDKIAVFLSQLL